MKKALYVLLALSIFSACDDSDDDNRSNGDVEKVENIAMNGLWRITYFFDTDKEETDNFNGYTFDFNNGNVLTATNGSNTYSGTWSVTDDGSGDDNNDDFDDIDFNIGFSNPDDFEELTEDWEIISLSNTKMELRHISGGNGGTDLLTLERI